MMRDVATSRSMRFWESRIMPTCDSVVANCHSYDEAALNFVTDALKHDFLAPAPDISWSSGCTAPDICAAQFTRFVAKVQLIGGAGIKNLPFGSVTVMSSSAFSAMARIRLTLLQRFLRSLILVMSCIWRPSAMRYRRVPSPRIRSTSPDSPADLWT